MKTPFTHNDGPTVNEQRMQEAFDVAAGRVVEVTDAHYAIVGRGVVETQSDALQGYSKFAWTIVYVQLNLEPDVVLLHWTDGVANDWGEWLSTAHEAFLRLNNITWTEYLETQMLPLDEFHSRYKKGTIT